MHLFSNLAPRFRFRLAIKTGVQLIARSFNGSANSAAQEESPFKEGYKALMIGVNYNDMNRGTGMAMATVDKYLKGTSLKIRQKKEIVQLATTVSDRRIRELIVKGVEKVGDDGLLSCQVGQNSG